MRFSLNSVIRSCSWPYQSNELLPPRSWKGDMAEKEDSVVPYKAQNGSTKSPNVSTDSGFEGEKIPIQRDSLASEEMGQWTESESRGDCLESQELSCPPSPMKHLDDSDFNDSPLEKRPIGSLSVDSDSVFPSDEKERCSDDSCLPTENIQIDVHFVQENGANVEPTPNLYPSSQFENLKHETASPSKDVQWQDGLYLSAEVCSGEADQSCDETYSDDALSTYYVPSSVSMATDDAYSQPPVRPPRASRPGHLRREETRSEADACEPSNKCLGTPYKSLRSQSDPSTHYTTVLKPMAIRPNPVSVDCAEYGSSFESLHLGQISAALVRYQNRRSAFREHLRSTLSQSEGVNILFSRSLETPPNIEPPRSNHGAVGGGTPHSSPIQLTPTRACSLNDVTSDSHFQCLVKMASSSSSLQAELCPAHATGSPRPNGCINSVMGSKRYSMPSHLNGTRKKNSNGAKQEPIHMTLEEVRNSLHALNISPDGTPTDENKSPCRQFIRAYLRSRKSKRFEEGSTSRKKSQSLDKGRHRRSFPSSVKAAFSNWFGFKRSSDKSEDLSKHTDKSSEDELKPGSANTSPFMNRALPPLPIDEANLWGPTVRVDEETSSLSAGSDSFSENDNNHNRMRKMDYAASIEKVKDCGWYWGPISGETAEKLLVNEPDGSFVLRDSSDEHYIFSLTFKLNGLVRHVRIEHDHGNFSFGCLQKFRSNTIVDFIENAVEHSRSGRYLFFLHRRPILGPMRVQLLHPVSRFKQVQSLQHLCRFIILKTVRRDLIANLPLPRRLKDYLNTPHYYSEELAHLPTPTANQQPPQTVSSQAVLLTPPLPPPDLESL